MEIIQHILITANGIHIRIDATAGIETVALESQPFPLCQGMDNLRPGFGMENIKGNRTFIAVQVIIQAGIVRHKKRCGDTVEVEES